MTRCEECQGLGFKAYLTAVDYATIRGLTGGKPALTGKVASADDMLWRPCPVCYGSGISYCCDEAGANPPNVHVGD